ncbi:hypothetical protein TETCHI1b_000142 [Candidatus Hodgkinia cicadicola]|nr:hypothetical protein TETCHI1b_000142 [Candidatus Hodgkinia cicadicola]
MKFKTRSARERVHRAISRALTSALKAKCYKNRLARLVSKLKRLVR